MQLRGKKRIEDLVRLLGGKPHASITDRHQHSLAVRALRHDGELAWPVTSFIASMLFMMRFIMGPAAIATIPLTWGKIVG
jgi:hypothetical protein